MPRFFFHLSGPDGRSHDEDGTEFASVDEAFLDLHRAVLDISHEMLLVRRDPNRHLFDVCDEAGRQVFELPFSEVLRSSLATKPVPSSLLFETIKARMRQSRALESDIVVQIAAARENLKRMQGILRGPQTAEDR